jgi:hypothetical protein
MTIQKFKETHRLMNKPGLAFDSTSRRTNFRTLVRVLLYGHVVHVSSRSLILVNRYEHVATVRDFYGGCNAMIKSGINLI